LSQRWLIIVVVAAIVVGSSAFAFWQFNQGEDQVDYLTAVIERGDISKTISATGQIQAVVTVQVGSQVSGTIAEMYVDYNSLVKKGQVVAKLDPATFQAQLDQARANLANAEASVRTTESAVINAEANLKAAEANSERTRVAMEDAQRVLRRAMELYQSGVIPQRDLESAQAAADQTAATYRQTIAQIDQAKAQLLSAKSQLNQAKAQVLQTTAAVQLAEVNLSHTIITAPIDGVVVARNIDVGQTVAASFQAPTLFLIANDLTKMQVLADIDEADVGQLGPQSQVTFTVDAYPRDNFRGRISQIRLKPEKVQNVVTYTAVIDVDNPELKLKPGMTANVTVTVANRKNVVKVPNAALRFRPELTEAQQKEVEALLAESNAPERSASAEVGEDGPSGESVPGGNGAAQLRRHRVGTRPGSRPAPDAITGWSPMRDDLTGAQVVWVLGANNQLHPVRVKLGITDGRSSELLDGDLKERDVVVTGQNEAADSDSSQRPRSLFGGSTGPSQRR
jgi:HlyD family secretion protein